MKLLFLLFSLFVSIAHAGSSTRSIYTPFCGYVPRALEQNTGSQGDWTTSGVMHCYPFIPCTGITNANQIKFILGDTNITNSTNKVGVAIYNASGDFIVRGTATYGSSDEGQTVTMSLGYPGGGTSFSLVDGTKYYQCQCSTVTSGGGGVITAQFATHSFGVGTAWADFMSAFASNRWGTSDSSHRCDLSTSLPPDTMGTLTPIPKNCGIFTSETCLWPLILKLATSTP